ncbi:uncharacterized protein LOC134655891 [Cydia amplana]|uniref:uncharacterized protein LOC134653119 n=1 Tax=Cydia amplana TaxID=1869771 RepID=UPI002FE6295E
MATSNSVGLFSSFNHQQQEWLTYKNRLEQWFIANNIDEASDKAGVRRRAILLSALNESTYQLASNLALPGVLENKSYSEVVKLLDAHFTPKRCVFAERYHFHSAMQKVGETSAQWAARLRGLAAHCQFKNIEEALLDRFIMGMQSGKEREKLFSKELSELTLAKAIEIAESVRCARAAASATLASTATAVVPGAESVLKIGETTGGRGNKCSVCGLSSHKTENCRYVNYKCKKCKKKGHLRKMCNLKYVESEEVSEDDDVLAD